MYRPDLTAHIEDRLSYEAIVVLPTALPHYLQSKDPAPSYDRETFPKSLPGVLPQPLNRFQVWVSASGSHP
ncbi:hypothetical protein ElyMa_001918900 [Elysia marginata]|uniref:Uncharacterized protein n=1 Tax=Elysia marginata TaxID=1093978 RepID=A0AAV4EUV5_9GAST|nr:hypothetical protein ElyMa_001918900 [Elysia marginata]